MSLKHHTLSCPSSCPLNSPWGSTEGCKERYASTHCPHPHFPHIPPLRHDSHMAHDSADLTPEFLITPPLNPGYRTSSSREASSIIGAETPYALVSPPSWCFLVRGTSVSTPMVPR